MFTEWRPTHSPWYDDNRSLSQMATNCYLLISKHKTPNYWHTHMSHNEISRLRGLQKEKRNDFLYQLFVNRVGEPRTQKSLHLGLFLFFTVHRDHSILFIFMHSSILSPLKVNCVVLGTFFFFFLKKKPSNYI